MGNIKQPTFNIEHPAVAVRTIIGCRMSPPVEVKMQRGGICWRIVAGFPLTPALSPSEGERENRPQSQRKPATEASSTTSESSAGGALLFPLPRRGGEGQGEGATA